MGMFRPLVNLEMFEESSAKLHHNNLVENQIIRIIYAYPLLVNHRRCNSIEGIMGKMRTIDKEKEGEGGLECQRQNQKKTMYHKRSIWLWEIKVFKFVLGILQNILRMLPTFSKFKTI